MKERKVKLVYKAAAERENMTMGQKNIT